MRSFGYTLIKAAFIYIFVHVDIGSDGKEFHLISAYVYKTYTKEWCGFNSVHY
jgi:hypothetical protein